MKRFFFLPIALALGAYLLLPLPGLTEPLSQKIESKRGAIEQKKRQEGVLTTTISGLSTRIDGLQGEINATQRRLSGAQQSLDDKRNELLAVRNKVEIARDRLERLRTELVAARRVLATRLVEIYKADQPDALTVVLESDGFGELLERAEFLDRISSQDREITDRVRRLRDTAHAQSVRLAKLEQRAQVAAEQILRVRDQIAATKNELVGSQSELQRARGNRRATLSEVRDSRQSLEGDLAVLERQQARIQAQLSGAGNTAFSGPIKHGSGQLIWPVNGPVVSPFGMRWGRLHAGVDIAVPTGTPIHAADAGRVVLMGWVDGYGNYTCIQHTSSLSTCYGHQSRFGTSNGAAVSQGQVIGYVGCTGHCFGPHVHFETRITGSPVDPMGYL
ncbi:MAG TPA: peptidoglycan DD-metalloendopeptidase family protein [Thermoleophilaceae bacterium]